MKQIVLVRHGQSEWNQKELFTGWKDVDLTSKGIDEAMNAGKKLKEHGFEFDHVYTSQLKRAIKTAHLILEEMNLLALPETKHWRLNERHYGALQGLSKVEMAKKHGEEQVLQWRRSYDTPPPALEKTEAVPYYMQGLKEYPSGESLAMTIQRVLPYWNEVIVQSIAQNQRLLIVAHGNSLRALMKHLFDINEQEILKLNIPTGSPLVVGLDSQMKGVDQKYL